MPNPKPWEQRSFDICYSGSLFPEIEKLVSSLVEAGLNVCVISHSKSKLVTHLDVSYEQKLALIANAKFALVHNQLFLTDAQLQRVRSLTHLSTHGAFRHLFDDSESAISCSFEFARVPQLKSRLFEAAMVGTLPLVISDRWRVVEDWFRPGEHFYFVDENNLVETLSLIEHDSENASKSHRLAQFTQFNYSTAAFANKYLA